MGELILTSSNIAATSYYIEDASLNVYSLEELSYYIYNNAYLLKPDFINEGLAVWIRDEIGDKRLSDEIINLLKDEAGLHILVGHILRNNGYLTKNEVKDCLDTIQSFEGRTTAEAKKLRADFLFKNNRIADAIIAYENLLEEEKQMEDSLNGDILHNLGCAQSRLFFFEDAIYNFDRAYRLNRNPESLKMLLISCMFYDKDILETMVKRYQVLPEDLKVYIDIYEKEIGTNQIKEFEDSLLNSINAAKDEVEKELILSKILNDFKDDYQRVRS